MKMKTYTYLVCVVFALCSSNVGVTQAFWFWEWNPTGGSCAGTIQGRLKERPLEVDLSPSVNKLSPSQSLGGSEHVVSQNIPTLKPTHGDGTLVPTTVAPVLSSSPRTQGQVSAVPQTSVNLPIISIPFINPFGRGMFFLNWLKAPGAKVSKSGHVPKRNKFDDQPSNPHDQENTGEKEKDSDKKQEPICHEVPEIPNMNRTEMQSCVNTKVGDRCRVRCVPNHEPTVKSVICVERNDMAQWDIPKEAECRPNTDPVCRDNFNRKVDWFVAYRLPKAVNHRPDSFLLISNDTMGPDDFINLEHFEKWRDGGGTNGFTNWLFDQGLFSQRRNAIGFTLAPVNQTRRNQNLHYLMYNDGTKGSSSTEHGHAKGILAHNERVGFFMIHNLPNFPGVKGQLDAGSDRKGQLFMCVTIDQRNVGITGATFHIKRLRPHVYSKTRGSLKNIEVPGPTAVDYSDYPIRYMRLMSEGGQAFDLMHKTSPNSNTQPSTDIYTLIANITQTNILVQSEMKDRKSGRGKLDSHCTGYSVENINSMYLPDPTHLQDREGVRWTSTQDHAKWLVAKDGGSNTFLTSPISRGYADLQLSCSEDDWAKQKYAQCSIPGVFDPPAKDDIGELFCAGDMNREGTQMERWGGAICMHNFRVARAFRQLVREEDIERCVY